MFCNAQKDKPGQDDRAGLSLVLHPNTGDLALMQWTIAGKQGRVADLDENNYVKCIVPVGPKKTPLKIDPEQILIPATGVKVLREKRRPKQFDNNDLNRLPDTLVRFMRMWRVARSQEHDGDGVATVMPTEDNVNCFVCGHSGMAPHVSVGGEDNANDHDDDDNDNGQNPTDPTRIMMCPVCLLCSHPSCCKETLKICNDRHGGLSQFLSDVESENAAASNAAAVTTTSSFSAVSAILPLVFKTSHQPLTGILNGQGGYTEEKGSIPYSIAIAENDVQLTL